VAFHDNRGMRFTLIEGGDIYAPRHSGVQPLLLADSKIARLGPVETTALHALSEEVTTIDATGCVVVPGLIDGHAHIIGAGGEEGFAIALARRGSFVDMDTVEEDVAARLPYYLAQGGPADRITISSDAHTPSGSTQKLYEQFVACVREAKLPLETVLACVTSNAAAVLKLGAKGNLAPGKDADVLILKQDSLEIVHLFARGRHVIRDGHYVEPSRQEQQVESGKE
jgi:imidazolonepropionase-like amidohydrolase